MATLDSLEPQRRAIIELLLRQGKGYEDIAGMLGMPADRVRELAREALVSLEPGSARGVHEDWRDQVADYVLVQQAAPEVRATRAYLKLSKPARKWVSSLLDSLDHLYEEHARPDVPEPDGGAVARPSRGGVRRPGAVAAGAAAGATAGRPRGRAEPENADAQQTGGEESMAARQPAPAGRSAAQGAASTRRTAPAPGPQRDGTGRPVPSPEAIARRGRLLGGALAAAAVVAAIVLAVALIGGGEEQEKGSPPATENRGPDQADQAQVRLLGQGQLESVGESDAQGVAVIAERGGETQLLVQVRGLEPSRRRAAYEVWLYNSRRDAVSLGGQVADQSGSLQGAGPLPSNFRSYRFIDISREKIDRDSRHSGDSVLRVPVSSVLRGAAAAGADAGGAGRPDAPRGGAAP